MRVRTHFEHDESLGREHRKIFHIWIFFFLNKISFSHRICEKKSFKYARANVHDNYIILYIPATMHMSAPVIFSLRLRRVPMASAVRHQVVIAAHTVTSR